MDTHGERRSVLQTAEDLPESRKPLDTAIRQQRMKAWQPVLDPWWVIATFALIGVVFIPTGIYLKHLSDQLVELKIDYDGHNIDNPVCGITTANENKECELEFTATDDMEQPIYVYYELDNFYQNHRVYIKSKDSSQLKGSLDQSELAQKNCEPLQKLGNQTLNPCGLIANTLFNDVFSLTEGVDKDGNRLDMNENGIAWKSDLDYKFDQPDGFKSEECDSCDTCSCDSPDWSCTEPYKDEFGKCHRYYYPNDDTTRYLYETYPMVVSPLEGVLNEHFVVWMRIAALPRFRKLYGYIEQDVAKGQKITFTLNANFEVLSFKGRKSLVLSTTNAFGGKNDYLGMFFILVGGVCLGLAFLFGLKQKFRPRKLGDRSYLKYKVE